MNLQSIAIIGSSFGLIILTGCSGGSPTATTPVTQPKASPSSQPIASSSPGVSKQSGIVVESGPYHVELVPGKEGSNTRLDLLLQRGDTHEPILGAKVTAQIQLPDGTQTTLDMIYDASAKHYAGKVASVAAGEYKVTVQSEIAGEKVNTRFSFKQ